MELQGYVLRVRYRNARPVLTGAGDQNAKGGGPRAQVRSKCVIDSTLLQSPTYYSPTWGFPKKCQNDLLQSQFGAHCRAGRNAQPVLALGYFRRRVHTPM